MSRPIAGLPCRIRIPVRQYRAVALVEHGGAHLIRLVHRDAGLSVDVEEFDGLSTAEEYCNRLADFLDLPTVMLGGGASSEEEQPETPPAPRRGLSARRRPRFLARRRPGGPILIRRIEGREIIARH